MCEVLGMSHLRVVSNLLRCDVRDNPRARAYREINKIPRDMGTAVNVQSMVYGNMGDDW